MEHLLQIILKGAGLCLVAILITTGCSHRGPATSLKQVPGRSCQDPEELVDVLSKFATAVSKRDYYKAISMLGKEDQAKMIDSTGAIPENIQRKLNALNFTALPSNPKIDLVNGRLTGVFDCLPCLDESDAPVLPKREAALEPPPTDTRDTAKMDAARLKDLSGIFFRQIHAGHWKEVAKLIHPQERDVFLFEKTDFSDWDKKRLLAIQECDLEALTLREDRLVGVILLLQPPVSNLWSRSKEFFGLIDAGDYEGALAMMMESEKRRFVDANGKLRADRVALLKNLDRSQWRKFSLYGDYLMGVSEAVLGYGNL